MYTLVLCSAMAIRSMCHGQPKCAATTVSSGCAAATGSSLMGWARSILMPWPPGWRAPMPLVPVWNRASSPCRSQAAKIGQYCGSSGANACSDGWNLTPRSPSAAMFSTSATAASPLCGSTEPRPVNTSG